MTEGLVIRLPKEDDIKKAALLEKEIFPHPWSESDFLCQSKDNNSLFLVADVNNKIVGYISVSMVLDESSINTIAVDKSYRGRGIARALIKRALKEIYKRCSFLTLEVRESNVAAISLYSSLEFKTVGKRPHYYRDPDETAILMTKYLK